VLDVRCLRNDTLSAAASQSHKFCLHRSTKYVYMAMEVAQSLGLNGSSGDGLNAADGDSPAAADDDDRTDHSICSPLVETNDNGPAAGDSVEERFRVDRRKLEQLIQGRRRDHRAATKVCVIMRVQGVV